MVTSTSRHRILALIARRGAASASQIGRTLNMSPAAVRHHLAILLADGRVAYRQAEPRRKRGRPERFYRLSDRLLGDNLAGLSEALLSVWLERLPAAQQEPMLRSLGERLASQAGPVGGGLPASKRLVEVVAKLNALSYQAHWEAGAQGPHLLLGHCPYGALIAKHPELCRMDAAFLTLLGQAPVEQLARMDLQAGGATHCIFAVREARAAQQPRS